MKTGKSVSELANEIVRQHNAKRDFIVPDQKINVYTNADLLELGFPLNGDDLFGGPLTENGHDQLGHITGIPARYYDLVRTNSAELLATNVRFWLDKSSDRRMIRTLDGNIRALLSDKYRRLDNYDLAQAILPILNDAQTTIESCEITDKKLYLKAVTYKVEGEVKVGDVVNAGVLVTNSEVGHGSLSVKPLVFRKVCSNGLVVDKYAMKKYHVGRQQELEQIEFSNETLTADDRAFWLKVRDLVKHSLSEVTFQKIISELKESVERSIEKPGDAVELVAKNFNLNKEEKDNVLTHLIRGGDLSSWGLGNAVTRAAQDVESYDRSTDLESIGFEIMSRSWN